jgi:polyisoprenoid-binding protein YceI
MTLGTIKIDAGSFVTDSSQRDASINRFILKTTDINNAFVTFTPTNITLPESITNGVAFTSSVEGNLTISGVTKPTTFKVIATEINDTLVASAEATIKRSDFDLTIPNVPFVADVSDDFDISGSFVAKLVQP